MICRNAERGEKGNSNSLRIAKQAIVEESGNANVELQILDVSRPQQIRDFAEQYNADNRPLVLCMSNALACIGQQRWSFAK